MAGLNISAVRYGIAAVIQGNLERAVNVYAYPPAILQYPAISIDHAGGNYAVTFGAQGLAQLALRVTIDVTAADMQAAAIALDDLLCAGTDATASVYDALTSDPTFGGVVGGSSVTDYTPPTQTIAAGDGVPVWRASFVVTVYQPRS